MSEKPSDNTTTSYAVSEAEDLPDGPSVRIDAREGDAGVVGARQGGVGEIKKEAKELPAGAGKEKENCEDCA